MKRNAATHGSSDVDMRSMFEYYLPAFHQAIVEGKAYSIMGAYNEVNHVPCNANTFLLNDLLRRKWGFEGYVVSDCGAVNDMVVRTSLLQNRCRSCRKKYPCRMRP